MLLKGRQFIVKLVFVLSVLSLIFSHRVFSQQLKILPLGNSITWGTNASPDYFQGDHPSYRYKLYQLLNQNGYSFDFIGSRSSGYNIFNDAQHCGIPGIRSRDVATMLQNGYVEKYLYYETIGPYLNYYPPDIILLEIGTNDVMSGTSGDLNDLSEFTDIFNAIDAFETSSGKPVLVFVAKIISTQNAGGSCTANANVNTFNANLTTIVNNRIANGDHLVFVDLQCGAGIDYNSDMLDTYHPNPAGYEKIGQTFFNAIHSFNSAPVISSIPNQTKAEGTPFTTINLDNYISDNEDADQYITWTTVPVPQNYTVTIVNRVATVTPKNADWNGSETITFKATDRGKVVEGLKKSASTSATFTVTAVNDAPVIISQITNISVPEDDEVILNINEFNISDPDNLPAQLTMNVLEGENYSFNGNTVKPSENFNGNLLVNIMVSDGSLTSDTFQAHVTVVPVNDSPWLTLPAANERVVDENTFYSVHIGINDVDTGDELSVIPVNLPSWLSFNTVNKNLEGTPTYLYIGNNTVTVRGTDGVVNVDSTFTILVNRVNFPPEFTSVPDTTADDYEPYFYQVIAEDPDNNEITLSVTEKPDWLAFDPVSGELSGTPRHKDTGDHTVIIKASDAYESTLQEFTIHVGDKNTPPEFVSVPDTSVLKGIQYAYMIEVKDVDEDDIITVTMKSEIPSWLQFYPESFLLIGRPSDQDVGNYILAIGASDGEATTEQVFLLKVKEISSVEVNKISKLQLYPIPVENELYFTAGDLTAEGNISVYNMSGKLVLDQKIELNSGEGFINVHELNSGIFLIRIVTGDSVFMGKMIKK